MTMPNQTGIAIKLQRGSTLLVALIMLVLLTLVAVSAINSTSNSVQMVGNAQFREEATAAAQQAIENVISNANFQTVAPLPQNIDVNNDGIPDYTVTFAPAPTCLSAKPVVAGMPGVPSVCASSIGTVCYWTLWDLRATVSDVNTGASISLHQGIRTIAGLNAAVASCGI
jgi:Tfp pilus assembly protein PilX